MVRTIQGAIPELSAEEVANEIPRADEDPVLLLARLHLLRLIVRKKRMELRLYRSTNNLNNPSDDYNDTDSSSPTTSPNRSFSPPPSRMSSPSSSSSSLYSYSSGSESDVGNDTDSENDDPKDGDFGVTAPPTASKNKKRNEVPSYKLPYAPAAKKMKTSSSSVSSTTSSSNQTKNDVKKSSFSPQPSSKTSKQLPPRSSVAYSPKPSINKPPAAKRVPSRSPVPSPAPPAVPQKASPNNGATKQYSPLLPMKRPPTRLVDQDNVVATVRFSLGAAPDLGWMCSDIDEQDIDYGELKPNPHNTVSEPIDPTEIQEPLYSGGFCYMCKAQVHMLRFFSLLTYCKAHSCLLHIQLTQAPSSSDLPAKQARFASRSPDQDNTRKEIDEHQLSSVTVQKHQQAEDPDTSAASEYESENTKIETGVDISAQVQNTPHQNNPEEHINQKTAPEEPVAISSPSGDNFISEENSPHSSDSYSSDSASDSGSDVGSDSGSDSDSEATDEEELAAAEVQQLHLQVNELQELQPVLLLEDDIFFPQPQSLDYVRAVVETYVCLSFA